MHRNGLQDAWLETGPDTATWTLVLAHGAGKGMSSPFMDLISQAIVSVAQPSATIRVLRFEFPYMRRIRQEGRRRPPDREPVLKSAFRSVAAEVRAAGTQTCLAIGGKSMGGRIASLLADELGVDALVCLGYPFHPSGRPERTRTAHLGALRTPTLICQGERDPFGTRDEVAGYSLSGSIELRWLEGADHDFRPRGRSENDQGQVIAVVADAVAGFLTSRHGRSDIPPELGRASAWRDR